MPLWRRGHIHPPLKTLHKLTPSVFDAPLSPLTICFTYIAGAEQLNTWNPAVFSEAVALHNECMRLMLAEFGGYESREQDGQVR